MRAAASRMREMGARAVLVKGGHLQRAEDKKFAVDVLDDAGEVSVFRGEMIETNATHGTGCTLAAAITACLARGMNLIEAVAVAKRFVTAAIRHAPHIGRGHSPVNHNVPVRLDNSSARD